MLNDAPESIESLYGISPTRTRDHASGESLDYLMPQSKYQKREMPIVVSSLNIDENQPANERTVEFKAVVESKFRDAGEQA